MPTNFYFNNFTNSQEQLLIEDLSIESIRIYGHDLYYLPRNIVARDQLYNQDDLSTFTKAVLMEMYIKNVEGFEGEGDIFSRFGVEIRDQITFTVAQRVFDLETVDEAALIRPREGDLIYLPLNEKVFEIKFVEHEAIFYQMGSLQTFDLTCELYEYSGERFNTGIEKIDEISNDFSFTRSLYVQDVAGSFQVGETISTDLYANNFLKATVASVIANTLASNAFTIEVRDINSDTNTMFFTADTTMTGETSGATGTIVERISENFDEPTLNDYFEDEGDNIIDFSETDPFSQGGTF